MTDISDQATEREEQFRKAALTAQAAKPAMHFKGSCYNCEAPLGETTSHSTRLQTTAAKSLVISNSLPRAGERTSEKGYLESLGCFCDTDCRDDYEKRLSRHRYELREKQKRV